jgi:KUP system potassium uptake protein
VLEATQSSGGDVDPAEHGSAGGHGPPQGIGTLALGALGVVFGDIGTSPLYAFREAFEHQHLPVVRANAMGLASIAFWALIIIVSVKYLSLVMRADNKGEGGILALTSLVMPERGKLSSRRLAAFVLLGVFGTSLLYGDGLITPAISVISAVEGFKVASSAFDRFVLPIACIILIGIFSVQRRGTGGIGKVFGPIMVVWFGVLGLLGVSQIVQEPGVLAAVNPLYIVQFFEVSPLKAFLSLGSIFLVVTGGEALYADMGHFGRRPISLIWFSLVLPCLLLSYFGQAALLIRDPSAIESPFYRMAPDWAITPLALLATFATIIAAQALISGAFSLTVQAVQLDYLPRLKVKQTSGQHQGQVYVPLVNWLLLAGCIALVLGFRSSSNLAAAYGIAVTTTMVITSLIFYVVTKTRWGWSTPKALLVVTPLLAVDMAFLTSNIPKIPEGGWFPLTVALLLLVQMTTWRRGRELVAARIRRGDRPIPEVLNRLDLVERVEGTAVFLFKDLGMAPPALISNMRHNKVVHEVTIIVSVETADVPRVDPSERCTTETVAPGVHQVLVRYGFMEEPNVPVALEGCVGRGFRFKPDEATYFIGRESVVAGKAPGMNPLRERLFVLLNRGASSASRFFHLPTDRVFEVGSQVEI